MDDDDLDPGGVQGGPQELGVEDAGGEEEREGLPQRRGRAGSAGKLGIRGILAELTAFVPSF